VRGLWRWWRRRTKLNQTKPKKGRAVGHLVAGGGRRRLARGEEDVR
jgi:hypothetical protein